METITSSVIPFSQVWFSKTTMNVPNPASCKTKFGRLSNAEIIVLLGVTVFVCFASMMVHILVLQNFPNSADEFAYLYQSKLFAGGNISQMAYPKQEFFTPFFIHTHQGKVFSMFPPGWPMVLSIGVQLGIPWFINPLLGALTIPVLFTLAVRLFDKQTAWTAIAVLILSPFFIFNSASYFSHPACLLFTLSTVLFLVLSVHSIQPLKQSTLGTSNCYAIFAGVFFSAAFITRELTALSILVIPLGYFFGS